MMVLELIILASACSASVFATKLIMYRKASSQEEETAPGTVNIELSYTVHPDDFFELLEADLTLFNPNDRVDLRIRARVLQGWKKTTKRLFHFGPIHGPAHQVVQAAKALLMDDDSPLTSISKTFRQKNQKIRAWGNTSGIELSWIDSDSVMLLTVTGTITSPPASEKAEEAATEVDLDLAHAEEEVDQLTRSHRASLRATRGKENG